VIWNFVLTAALGAQRLAILIGLDGLLPGVDRRDANAGRDATSRPAHPCVRTHLCHAGEEVVTKESFISICWRLIPYWLNNWEQAWGAECSSMMFELPHFAIELLVVLPCVQLLCSRMKILVMPVVELQAAAAHQDEPPLDRSEYAPNILKGYWEHRPVQKKLMPRLR